MKNNIILSDTLALAITKVTTTCLGLLCIRIISDGFTLSEYGTYSQGLLIVSTLSSLTILGLTDATNYFFNKGIGNKYIQEKYISTIIAFQIFIGGFIGLLVLLFSSNIAEFFHNDDLENINKWIAFMPLCLNMIAILQVLFISVGKSKLIALRNFIVSIIRLLIFIIGCYITKDIKTIIALTLVCDIAQIYYFRYLLEKEGYIFSLFKFDKKLIQDILKFGIPMSIYIISNSLLRDCDKYIVSYFTETETLAIYTNASKILPFDLLTTSFATVLLPILTRSVTSGNKSLSLLYISKYLNFSFLCNWILITGSVLCSKEIMILLYGEKYVSGTPVFIVYLMVSLIRFANMSLLFSAAGKTKIIMQQSVIILFLNLILSILLFYIFDTIGCAIATLIVSILSNIYLFYKAQIIVGKTLFSILDWVIYVKLFIVTVFMLCILYHLKKIFIFYDIPIIVSTIIIYGIFVVTLFFLFKKTIINYIKN